MTIPSFILFSCCMALLLLIAFEVGYRVGSEKGYKVCLANQDEDTPTGGRLR